MRPFVTSLAIVSALVFGSACSKKPAPAPEPAKEPVAAPEPAKEPVAEPAKEPAAVAVTGMALKDWYVNCWRLFETKDWDSFQNCYAEDAVSSGSGRPDHTGRAAILDNSKGFKAAYSDARGQPQLILVHGNTLAAVVLFRGTNDGAMKGPGGEMPATNKQIGLLQLHVVETDGHGHVTRESWTVDLMTMMSQLGVAGMPGRPLMTEGAPEPTVIVAGGTEAEAQNLAAHKKAYELMAAHDKSMYDIIADDAVYVDLVSPKDLTKADMVARDDAMRKGFSDFTGVLGSIFAAGDYTFATMRLTGTNDGDMPIMGLSKTGKKIEVAAAEILQWKDGKVVHAWMFANGMDFAEQLGLVPQPAGAAAPPDAPAPATAPAPAPNP